jgi:hypothetical protein
LKIRDEFLRRIESSADALTKAAVRQIDQWMRDGLSFEEILRRLKTLRLSPAESAKLQTTFEQTMNDIVVARGATVNVLSNSNIESIMAASWISMPRLKKEIQDALIPTVQRAIDAEIGPTALSHQLRQLELQQPKTLAYTSLAQFNNGLTIATGEASGVERYLWDGPPPMPTSHLLCKQCAGDTFTLAQLDAMDNGTGMLVRTSLGGYGCRHYLTAMTEEQA